MASATKFKAFCLTAALACVATAPVTAQELITNGGFESGLTGWTRADQIGGDGSFIVQSGPISPVNGLTVPAPPEGTNAAMTDAEGPGSHVLYQDFLVPAGVLGGTLRFDRYVNNLAETFFSPDTLDFTSVNNQQARVDILLPTADPFSVAPGDVLRNLFVTMPGDPPVSGYSTVTADISSLLADHAGQTLRLRFAEVDNHLFLNYGVDRVSINTAGVIPEPGTAWLLASGILPLAGAVRRRRRKS